MRLEYLLIMVFTAVVLIILAFACIEYKTKNRKLKDDSDWLLGELDKKLFYCFTKKKPNEVAKSLGINIDQYKHNCDIAHVPFNLEGIITTKILGILAMFGFIIWGVFTENMYLGLAGCIMGFLLYSYPLKSLESKAKKRKLIIENELPRFLDLLQTALYINLPIEDAIMVTARNLKETEIADEFSKTVVETRLGAYDWEDALSQMAYKFNIDDFSDFVMDLTIGYEKGLNIYDVIVRKNEDIKKSNLLHSKERASKLNSELLIPIAIFKFVPLLVLLFIPIASQLKNSGW